MNSYAEQKIKHSHPHGAFTNMDLNTRRHSLTRKPQTAKPREGCVSRSLLPPTWSISQFLLLPSPCHRQTPPQLAWSLTTPPGCGTHLQRQPEEIQTHRAQKGTLLTTALVYGCPDLPVHLVMSGFPPAASLNLSYPPVTDMVLSHRCECRRHPSTHPGRSNHEPVTRNLSATGRPQSPQLLTWLHVALPPSSLASASAGCPMAAPSKHAISSAPCLIPAATTRCPMGVAGCSPGSHTHSNPSAKDARSLSPNFWDGFSYSPPVLTPLPPCILPCGLPVTFAKSLFPGAIRLAPLLSVSLLHLLLHEACPAHPVSPLQPPTSPAEAHALCTCFVLTPRCATFAKMSISTATLKVQALNRRCVC